MSKPSVLTIGNFDGVHRGHQAIVGQARHLADQRQARVVALSFDPHPASTLRPGSEPPRLTSTARRIDLLKQAGADEVHLLQPTREFLAQTPEAFIESLCRRWQPTAIVEGEDFRFGKKRAGDMALLRQRGGQHGFDVLAVPGVHLVLNDGSKVQLGSSLSRWLVGHGRMAEASTCLGRAFELTAPVVRGEQQGRQLGVPTANLDLSMLKDFIIPADGVYAGYAQLSSSHDEVHHRQGQRFSAAISVGVKPTFGEQRLTVEAHLLDLANHENKPLDPLSCSTATSSDSPATTADPVTSHKQSGKLYGTTIHLGFARWLRDQYAYPNVDSLKAQLQRDIEQTRHLDRLDGLGPGAAAGIKSGR